MSVEAQALAVSICALGVAVAAFICVVVAPRLNRRRTFTVDTYHGSDPTPTTTTIDLHPTRRQLAAMRRVMVALEPDKRLGLYDLGRATRMRTLRVVRAVDTLRAQGVIVDEWVSDPPVPDRRRYYLTGAP